MAEVDNTNFFNPARGYALLDLRSLSPITYRIAHHLSSIALPIYASYIDTG